MIACFKLNITIMVIYVNNEEVQEKVQKDFGIRVPLYQCYCTKDKIVNSPLWFEMWQPHKQVEDSY